MLKYGLYLISAVGPHEAFYFGDIKRFNPVLASVVSRSALTYTLNMPNKIPTKLRSRGMDSSPAKPSPSKMYFF